MEFRILGPFEVSHAEGVIVLGPRKQRALLAVLLLHANEVVTSERLIDELWGDDAPATAAKSVQVYVSQIRKGLRNGGPVSTDGDVLLTRAGGYVLTVGPGALDAWRFERALEEGQRALGAGQPERAAGRLREGLALWRGPPLADFAYDAFAQAEIARLEELHLSALEERIDADIALGRHGLLVGELETLVSEHPLRERLRAQLMLALYRCDRQAEALEVYRQGRLRLVEDLGLEPSPTLQRLERSILGQSPELALHGPGAAVAESNPLADAPPAARPAPAGRPERAIGSGRPGRRRARVALVGGSLLIAAAAAGAALRLAGPEPAPRARIAAPLEFNAIASVDRRTGEITAAVPAPGRLGRLGASAEGVWVGSDDSGTISSVDPHTQRMTRTVVAGGFPSDVAVGAGAVWVVDGHRGVLQRIQPGYANVTDRIALRRPAGTRAPPADRFAVDPSSVAVGGGSVWVTDGSRRLLRVDPASARVVDRVDARRPLTGVAVGAGAVWAIASPAAVLRIDPASARVTDRIAIVGRAPADAPYPVAVAAAGDLVWVLNANTATVTKIDAHLRGVVQTTRLGVDRAPQQIAAEPDAAWVAGDDGTLTRIDARTGESETIPVGHGLRDVAISGDRVWVVNQLTRCCGQE
jgi:DNA-binding SARP family transcriptional activator/DNA-binding beta-propeller fold protein YncE